MTPAPRIEGFDTRAGFQAALAELLARSFVTLDMFDPDFGLFMLGTRDVDAALRRFLRAGGLLRLAMHATTHIERHDARFLRLLREFGHGIECRVTPPGLRRLTDSFAIGDGVHVVRRFHSAHLRGEAAFESPPDIDLPRQRFGAIWADSDPGLHAGITGL